MVPTVATMCSKNDSGSCGLPVSRKNVIDRQTDMETGPFGVINSLKSVKNI
jgi:hypothetical protein